MALRASVEGAKREGTQFRYVIKFVTDMNKAVEFYRDTFGLPLRFESPSRSLITPRESTGVLSEMAFFVSLLTR